MGCIREQVNSQFLNFMFWKGHGPNSMEARFRYWIKTKKVIATFNLTISDFFHRIVRYKLSIVRHKVQFLEIKSELYKYIY